MLYADLEVEEGRNIVLRQMKEGSLVVMSEFLHCLESPEEVVSPFSSWNWVVLEYNIHHKDFGESYKSQLSKMGANPLSRTVVEALFKGRPFQHSFLDPYHLWLVKGAK